ncbi:hypothetical protein B9N43_02025 [Denitratisoma sp. DHT3]|uniref:FIST signal transduction protein n=1 Tax=Denitratisoma sp. DHT3 TaxID=1981880 RepID=UPI0011985FA7|nr:FIST N-terminal domain-containing protein [Denitratisoma sp. DHT3]QDX80141.1 hypothetical protein B9N43_02025 [Denitratisoma sp. DHT3]
MKISQTVLRTLPDDLTAFADGLSWMPDLLLVFGSVAMMTVPALTATLKARFAQSVHLGCSTAGEIAGEHVCDGSAVVTAIKFSHGRAIPAATTLAGMNDSRAAGVRLGQALAGPGLKAAIVFGPGVAINGTALVDGMASILGDEVPISGGLAGDGGAFVQTWTLDNAGPSSGRIVAVGLVGDELTVSHGCFGGWKAFGPTRKVTRCVGNVLYELDNEPALAVYKRYLGDYAKELPAAGLLFPFEMLRREGQSTGLIRTILGVDETAGALVLAGEVEPDGFLRLMHSNTDGLVSGAETAADRIVSQGNSGRGPSLALLVSCVGRKLVMGGRVDEELEAVALTLGKQSTLTGFYSYGEISPVTPEGGCALHNQTMTITSIHEDCRDSSII